MVPIQKKSELPTSLPALRFQIMVKKMIFMPNENSDRGSRWTVVFVRHQNDGHNSNNNVCQANFTRVTSSQPVISFCSRNIFFSIATNQKHYYIYKSFCSPNMFFSIATSQKHYCIYESFVPLDLYIVVNVFALVTAMNSANQTF